MTKIYHRTVRSKRPGILSVFSEVYGLRNGKHLSTVAAYHVGNDGTE